MTDKEKLIKSYEIFMGRAEYDNAYEAIKKLWEIDGRGAYKYIKDLSGEIRSKEVNEFNNKLEEISEIFT